MIRQALAAAALLAAAPAAAQNQQEALDARYDRALAAGYKALFLCSAIANAERNGTTRTVESVEKWELTGIQAPLDEIASGLPYEVIRYTGSSTPLREVRVTWNADMPPRRALHDRGKGCFIAPLGYSGSLFTSDDAPAPDYEFAEFMEGPGDESIQTAVNGAFLPDEDPGPRTTAVIVVRNRQIEAERYAEGFSAETPQRTWSVAKSIAASLVGAAVQRKELDLDSPAPIAAWSIYGDPRSAITVDNLLRMASGRYSDTPGNRTDPLYFGGSTVDETAAHWPLIHKPGTVFRYANNDTLMAVEAISPTFEGHPPAEFFAKLGMLHTVAETDWQGDYVLSSQIWSTARDLAKLGQLYLDDGMWNGERILPENWREYVSWPAGPQPDGPFGYGAGFWLFDKSDGVPPDTFAAMGNRGQFVVIVPSRNVVIVRRGEDPAGSRFDIAAFTRDVLAALSD